MCRKKNMLLRPLDRSERPDGWSFGLSCCASCEFVKAGGASLAGDY